VSGCGLVIVIALALMFSRALAQSHEKVSSMSSPTIQPATKPAVQDPLQMAQAAPAEHQLAGAVYYVAPSGNDSAAGSAEHPFATIQKAASVVKAQDVVKIAPGVYHERIALARSGNYFGRVIRFEGAGPDKTIIDAQGLSGWSRGTFDTAGRDYVEIVGIGVCNSRGAGFSIYSSWQVTLENCRSFNSTDSGIKIDKSGTVRVAGCEIVQACWHGGEESLSVKRSQDVQIVASHIHNTGHEGIDVKEGSKHVRVIGNQIHNVERQGLYAEAWDSPTFDIRFENNRVHDCQFGIAAGSECGGLLSDVWFENNVVYNNLGPGMIMADWGDHRFSHPVKDIHFIRNTVVNNGTERWGGGMVFENTDVTAAEVTNNILSHNTQSQLYIKLNKMPQGVTIRDNVIDGISETLGTNLTGPVQFADPAHGDFTVTSGPAGMDAGARPSDTLGSPRG
jgi:polygalacturonase